MLDVDILQMERICQINDDKDMSYEDHLSAEEITYMITAIYDIATMTIWVICNSLMIVCMK